MEKQERWTTFKYRLLWGAGYLLSLLPLRLLYVLSDALFLLVYYCVRYRRGVVRDTTFEMSLAQFQQFAKSFKDIAALMETL